MEKGSDDLSRQQWSTKWMSEYIFEYELLNAWIFVTKEILCTKTDLSVYPDIWSHFKRFSGMYATFAHFHIEFGVTSCFSHFWWVLIVIIKEKKKQHSPLLQTLLSSSIGPLESLSSSCRCKWLCWLKWWWFRPRLWCKWCRWLLLLFAADALKSRGLSGDGERPPFSTCSRLRWSAAPAAPPPPKISVIIKRDRDGRTAIDPLCIGTVILKSRAAAATPFDDNKSAVLVIVDDFGLAPVECHWSTILIRFPQPAKWNFTLFVNVLVGCFRSGLFCSKLPKFVHNFTVPTQQIVLFFTMDFLCQNQLPRKNENSIKTLA